MSTTDDSITTAVEGPDMDGESSKKSNAPNDKPSEQQLQRQSARIAEKKNKAKGCSCPICELPDDDNMVVCDNCEIWHHYICVNVDKSQIESEDADWFCPSCVRRQKEEKRRLRSFSKSNKNSVSKGTSYHSELQLIAIEEMQRIELERLQNVAAIEKKRLQAQAAIDEYEAELKNQDMVASIKKKFVQEKVAVQTGHSSKHSRGSSLIESEKSPMALDYLIKMKKFQDKSIIKPTLDDCHDREHKANQVQQESKKCTDHKRSFDEDFILTAPQVMARQALEKIDLPKFDGNPADWPLFITSYNLSTARCGYTDVENMIRLKSSLKGPALKAVSGRLFFPSQVPSAIKMLSELYGRPEKILFRLIKNIRGLPQLREHQLDGLVEMALEVDNLCGTIQATLKSEHLSNPVLQQELVEKLPSFLRIKWSRKCVSNDDDNLLVFRDWLNEVASSAGRVSNLEGSHIKNQTSLKDGRQKAVKSCTIAVHDGAEQKNFANEKNKSSSADSDLKCKICGNGAHKVEKCEIFQKMNSIDRWDTVLKHRLCGKCLGYHFYKRCKTNKRCSINDCGKVHHEMVHRDRIPENERHETSKRADSEEPKPSTSKQATGKVNHHRLRQDVQFRVIPVRLYGPERNIDTYAFFDEGSTITLVEERIATTLGLTGPSTELCLTWTGDVGRVEDDSQRISLEIAGVSSNSKRFRLTDCYTVSKLGLPSQSVSIDVSERSNGHLLGIPIPSYTDGCPTVLIGQDHFQLGLPLEIRQGKWDEPVAARTRLGWSIFGAQNSSSDASVNVHMCMYDDYRLLHDMMKNHMTLESFGVGLGKIMESKNNERAISILSTSTKENGRYTAGLLWKEDNIELPESKNMAMRRLLCLERKLKKDTAMCEYTKSVFDDYEKNGYIRKLTVDEVKEHGKRVWYMPVFFVSNPNKPGKHRPVWDAAAKSNGISLNDMLLKGPDQLTTLPYVLYNFREQRYAVVSDIKQMFHQVRIRESDQHAQRFLWRKCDENIEPSVYVMTVMTFGANCSPCTAQYIKNRNADDYLSTQPRAVKAIKSYHYVDDYLDSFSTQEEAIEVSKQVRDIQKAGGFELRNWESNSPEILQALGEKHPSCNKSIDEKETQMSKVLGIKWNSMSDVFSFSVNRSRIHADVIEGRRPPTKREICSTLMSVFDPLGLISSYLVLGKIILQDVWRSGVNWDEPVQESEHEKWMSWLNTMKQLENLQIPRCYGLASHIVSREVHVFVDASERVFAAVAYIRSVSENGVEIRMIGSKTRVAPQKPLSIPRLELMAAVLGSRLLKSIIDGHTIQFDRKFLWSDSQTVISWLQSEARKYKQFVSLRIGEILESTEVTDWHWVSTKDNVADEGTKWPANPQFNSESRWFTGPRFMYESEETWPKNDRRVTELPANEFKVAVHVPLMWTIREITPNFNSFSSWTRLVRVQAMVARAGKNWYEKVHGVKSINTDLFTVEELDWAKTQLLKRIQLDCFGEVVAIFQQNSNAVLEKTNVMYKYSPFMSPDGLIRMRGRISEAEGVPYSTKFPVILDKNHKITALIVDAMHKRFLHRNQEIVVSELRKEYVIPQIRRVLRTVRSQCQRCKNSAARPEPPMMAELPLSRLSSFTRPFSFVGVDCFGPFEVTIGRRLEKRWGVLYTCMTIRAIHIELVASLSTDSFIMSLKRFMSRRGTPIEITSDNGTNFRGATRELQGQLKGIDPVRVQSEFTSIRWKFNPPGTPHFGGSWERLIQSVKSNLQEIITSRKPKEEVLLTALIDCENIVNSCPLTHVPIDDEDAEPLTPNHFLVGSSDGVKPLADLSEVEDSAYIRKGWKITEMITKQFWRKWRRDYLPSLAKRTKWFAPTKTIQIGDIVIVMDDNGPLKHWPKGKVIDTHMAKDGQVRSVKVQMATGIYTRPVVLAVLDVRDDNHPQIEDVIGVENVGERAHKNIKK